MVVGIQSPDIFKKDVYNRWVELSNSIQKLKGIKQVLSSGRIFQLEKDTVNQKFVLKPIPGGLVKTDMEMDSIKNTIYNNLSCPEIA
ncbi:Fis family transcriptional regulator, partial [Pedobacter sp. KBW01]